MTKQELDFKLIYEENHSRIMRLCMGYVARDQDLANDLTQEVFIKVWRNLKSFKNESNISTWIYRIAVNTCLMNLRKNRSSRSLNIIESKDLVESDNQSEEVENQYKQMYRCIDTLSATNKAIVMMELEGMAQKEIANIMGLKHEAVRTRIHRIKTQLSKCVNHE
ncbi:MAG: sigma-70 family RNA polymerase sigma factor [Bacteroidota bacterium]